MHTLKVCFSDAFKKEGRFTIVKNLYSSPAPTVDEGRSVVLTNKSLDWRKTVYDWWGMTLIRTFVFMWRERDKEERMCDHVL